MQLDEEYKYDQTPVVYGASLIGMYVLQRLGNDRAPLPDSNVVYACTNVIRVHALLELQTGPALSVRLPSECWELYWWQ